MKRDTCFLIISLSLFSAVAGGYIGTMLSHIPQESSTTIKHNLDGHIGFVKNTVHASSVEHRNNVRTGKTGFTLGAQESNIAVNDTSNGQKPQVLKQLNSPHENGSKQNPLKPKQFLDKTPDALSDTNQPEEVQAAEVDGVRYSITKSDKSFVVQTSTEIPDADIAVFMDVFTKMVDVEKFKNFHENNDMKILEQAVGAYNFIEGTDMRITQWCEPHYSLKVLPDKMRAQFATRKQYAATLLKDAWGDNWKTIISNMQELLAPKIMQAAERDYQAAKSMAAEYNEKLSQVKYCKMLDDDNDYLVSHNVKLFKQLYPDIDNVVNLNGNVQPVIYNHVSKIYHKPDCDWGQKCDNNCLKTQKGAAIMDGGRPCHVCGG